MDLKELADRLEALDVDAFAVLLDMEESHDEEPERAKRMIIDALRLADAHGRAAPRPRLDAAD